MKQDLKQMYGSTPESFKHRVTFALKETEEKPVKHTVRTILITAIIILLLTAVAYAAFSSQVAAFFGKSYGENFETWLEQGEVSTVAQSYTLGDVVFTVDEVIYRDNGLYGVGTIRPAQGSNAVIISDDHTTDEPFGYDIHGESGYPEEAPAGTPTIAEVAAEQGGKILVVRALPDQISVDGGELLSPGCIGTSMVPQRDGSIQYSFEISDGFVIEEGDTYTISMFSRVCEMTADGEWLNDTKQTATWTVECTPEPMSEQATEPAAADVPVPSLDGLTLIVPDEYTQAGTLPVYTAITRDFGADLQPDLFNQSGIAKTENYLITFNDEAQLSWAPEALFYSEYQGTYNINYKDTSLEPSLAPLKTLRHAASDLAGDVRSGWPDESTWEGITLDKTALAGITLDDAKAKLETLLAALNVDGYTCAYALDMDVARIQSMGAVMNQLIEENQYWNPPILDYSLAAESDEGFYLYYTNGVKTDGDRFAVYAYVTADGIADLQIRDLYIQGDIYAAPEYLIDPETIPAALSAEIADSRFPDMTISSISSIELTYTPARASSKADGMVLTPAWYVTYRDPDAEKYNEDCFAIFNAVDGSLISASFQ
ncbi:MAG TPA: hypothetical protein PK537_10565 [Candidatus Limiplasma sp.]|nr:hypothetical protein [Candidatus Limiplasma sp.]